MRPFERVHNRAFHFRKAQAYPSVGKAVVVANSACGSLSRTSVAALLGYNKEVFRPIWYGSDFIANPWAAIAQQNRRISEIAYSDREWLESNELLTGPKTPLGLRRFIMDVRGVDNSSL